MAFPCIKPILDKVYNYQQLLRLTCKVSYTSIVMCTHIVSLSLLVPPSGLLVVRNLPDVVLVKREHAVTTLHSTGHCTRSADQQWNS